MWSQIIAFIENMNTILKFKTVSEFEVTYICPSIIYSKNITNYIMKTEQLLGEYNISIKNCWILPGKEDLSLFLIYVSLTAMGVKKEVYNIICILSFFKLQRLSMSSATISSTAIDSNTSILYQCLLINNYWS